TGEPVLVGYAELCAGIAATFQGRDPATARGHFEAALRLARALDADLLTVLALTYCAELVQLQGQPAEARELWRGGARAPARAPRYRALGAGAEGDWAQAATEWRRGLMLADELGSTPFRAIALAGTAGVLTARGQPQVAARLLGAIDRVWCDEEQLEFYRQP